MPPASVEEAFDELLSRIELNPTRVTLASQRYNAVKATIENAISGKTVRQIGSFQRKTKIRPLDLSDKLDIDALVSFGTFRQYATDGRGVSPASALETVRRALASNETYRVMPQEQDHPIIRLQYADDMSIELTPAYEDLTGQHPHANGEPNCYIVSFSPYNWKPADYDYDAALITKRNTATDGKLVPTIKLAKAYFRSRGVTLKSFHTEVLVANVVPSLLAGWKAQNYTFGYHHILSGFLSSAADAVISPVALSGSYSPALDSDIDAQTLKRLGEWIRGRADKAWELCKIKAAGESIKAWRDFFGEPFPA
jgi:hypothetical protein